MLFQLEQKTVSFAQAYSGGLTSSRVGAIGGDSYSAVAIIDVDTPAAVIVASAAIVFATGVWTSTAHGLSTGLKVQLSTSSALPTPLATSTDYFIIAVSANTFKIASSLVNAQAGTAITLSDSGVGNQTVTPTALAGGTIKLQGSNDGTNWVDIGSATNVTADGNVGLSLDRPTYSYIRPYITLTAGHITASVQVLVKGDKE